VKEAHLNRRRSRYEKK